MNRTRNRTQYSAQKADILSEMANPQKRYNEASFHGSFNTDLHDIYIELAANTSLGTWAANLKSISSPSIRHAGKRDVSHLEIAGEKSQYLHTFSLITTVGSITHKNLATIKEKTGHDYPRLHIRVSQQFAAALQDIDSMTIPQEMKDSLRYLFSKFQITFDEVVFNDHSRDYITTQLNLFSRRMLHDSHSDALISDTRFKPDASSIAEFHRSRYGDFPKPKTVLADLNPRAWHKGY